MKHRRIPHLAGIVALACATALFAGSGALQKGQKVWSKHHETGLLAEPSPLAGAQATVGFAEKLKILEVRGAWLRVRGDGDEGWVFEGNVAADQPELPPATALTMVATPKGSWSRSRRRPSCPADRRGSPTSRRSTRSSRTRRGPSS